MSFIAVLTSEGLFSSIDHSRVLAHDGRQEACIQRWLLWLRGCRRDARHDLRVNSWDIHCLAPHGFQGQAAGQIRQFLNTGRNRFG